MTEHLKRAMKSMSDEELCAQLEAAANSKLVCMERIRDLDEDMAAINGELRRRGVRYQAFTEVKP